MQMLAHRHPEVPGRAPRRHRRRPPPEQRWHARLEPVADGRTSDVWRVARPWRDRHLAGRARGAWQRVACTAMPAATATSPLRHSELRRIVAAYTVNRLGTWFGFIALAVVVFDHTHSALAVAALLLASQVLPAFLVPALVARVEASTRRGELSGLYLFEAVDDGALDRARAVALLAAGDPACSSRSTARRRWRRARCCARPPRAARATGCASSSRERPIARESPSSCDGGRAQGERGAERRLRGDVRARPGARRASSCRRSAPRRRCSSTSVSFVICGALLIDLRPHVEDAETRLGARAPERRVALHQRGRDAARGC